MKNKKMIFVVFIVALNLRLGISSIPPLIGMIKQDLQLNNFQVSLLTSIPVICMGMMAFGVKRMQQQFGRDRSILACLFIGDSNRQSGNIFKLYKFSHFCYCHWLFNRNHRSLAFKLD